MINTHISIKVLLVLSICFMMVGCSDQSTESSALNVAVANNVHFAMNDIAEAFEQKHHVEVNLSIGSSGILATQIKQGAPFDVFICADMKYPNQLFQEQLTIAKPKVYAQGFLILWSTKRDLREDGLLPLKGAQFEKIAIANPETAPYGIAAVEALKNAGIYNQVKKKIVLGEGIGQVNQYIESRSVDAGITSRSVLFTELGLQGTHAVISDTLYSSIDQGIVVLKNENQQRQTNAKMFYKFMFSDEAKAILTKFGYEVNGT